MCIFHLLLDPGGDRTLVLLFERVPLRVRLEKKKKKSQTAAKLVETPTKYMLYIESYI